MKKCAKNTTSDYDLHNTLLSLNINKIDFDQLYILFFLHLKWDVLVISGGSSQPPHRKGLSFRFKPKL